MLPGPNHQPPSVESPKIESPHIPVIYFQEQVQPASRQGPQGGSHSIPPHFQGKHPIPTVYQTDIETSMESILFGSALTKIQKPESWGTEHLGKSASPEDPPP